jgi:hypothetical protein
MCLRSAGFIIRSAGSLLLFLPFEGRREPSAADEKVTIDVIKLLTRFLVRETIQKMSKQRKFVNEFEK